MDSAFLNLPGEIRNQIYRELLVINTPPQYPQPKTTICPLILAVCKQIHQEASAILYGENVFIANESLLTDMPRLRKWFKPIHYARCIALISRYHVYIRLDCDSRFKTENARRQLSGLDYLTVEVFQAQFGSCDFRNLRKIEGVRGVKEVKVFGSTNSCPSYAKWLEGAMMTPSGIDVNIFNEQEEIARMLG